MAREERDGIRDAKLHRCHFDYKNYRSALGLLIVLGVLLTPGHGAVFTPVITENDR